MTPSRGILCVVCEEKEVQFTTLQCLAKAEMPKEGAAPGRFHLL